MYRSAHSYFIPFLFLIFPLFTGAQSPLINWTASAFDQKVFVENKGQWDALTFGTKILFHTRNEGADIYITADGIIFKHDKKVSLSPEEQEIRWKDSKTKEQKKKEGHWSDFKLVPEILHMKWEGAANNAIILPLEKQSAYHTFGYKKGMAYETIRANSYKKIQIKNLYPGIDLEFSLSDSKSGIKYDLIVHPGADPSLIKMKYSNAEDINQDLSGNVIIKSAFGNFTDQAPLSFYQSSPQKIHSSFQITGNTVSFLLGSYDHQQTLVIDPWITNPAFTGYNSGYDINYDNAGNVYAFGSYNPLQLMKFDNTGAWLWTYNMLGGYYAYGDFSVDENTGFSYLAEGKTGPTLMHKVDPAGALVAQNASTSTEMWRMDFNRATNEFIIGGTGSGVEIMDVNLNFSPTIIPPGTMNDNTLLCIDNCSSNNDVYVAGNSAEMLKVPATTLAPVLWTGNDGYTFQYAGCRNVGGWTFPVMGYNGMAVSANWLYTYDGDVLKKWDKMTGAFQSSVSITGNPFLEGGITTDHCNNVYVGANNSVMVYDPNLSLLATIALPDTVYDLKMGRNNLLYATGQNFVTEILLPSSLAVVLTLSQTPASCTACNGTANVVVSNSCLNTTYVWNPGNQTSATATGLCSGVYTVTVTNACNDTYTDTITVQGPVTLTLSVSQQNILCNGQNTGTATATPTGTAPYTYSWSNAQTGQTASNLGAGTYTVTVTDANGCTQTATVTITQPTVLSANASSTNTTCGNANGTASVTVGGGTGPYTYSWAPSGGTAANASGLSSGVYTVTVTDANNCTSTAIVSVAGSNGPTLALQSQVNVTCAGGNTGSATMNPTGTGPFTYSWNTVPVQTSVTATGLAAGSYTCTVTDANGCTSSQTVTITQGGGPTATANASLSTVMIGNSSQLTATGGGTYSWSPATGLSCTTCANPVASPNQTTTYCVTVTDGNGCTDTACTTITVELPCGTIELSTLLPNAFSPNSDALNNQYCVPPNVCIKSFKLIVFDRWGEKVFTTDTFSTCWDGTFKNKVLNPGVFAFYFDCVFVDGQEFSQKGNISLIR